MQNYETVLNDMQPKCGKLFVPKNKCGLYDIIPAEDFSAEDTVKDAIDKLQTDTQDKIDIINTRIRNINDDIDDLESIIPSNRFSAQSTVKDYIDNEVSEVADLLPASAFDSVNTVRGALNGRVRAFETVADMAAATDLATDMICHTNGFHTSGDGGAAFYEIKSTGTANAMDIIACQDSLLAHLVITEPFVTPEMFGAYGDGTHDDTNAFQYACNNFHYVKLSKTYSVATNIVCGANSGEYAYTAAATLLSNSKIEFDNGIVRLQAASNRNPSCFIIEEKENIYIGGNGSVIGEKDIHTGSAGENGHCFYLWSSENITIEGLNISNSWGDGVSATESNGTNSNNIKLKDLYITDCGRCGVSFITCDNWSMENCYVEAATRTNPKCALDIEPNENTTVNGTNTIENCTFVKVANSEYTLGVSIQPNTTFNCIYNFNNITFKGQTLIAAPALSKMNVSNIVFDGLSAQNKMELGAHGKLSMSNVSFTNIETAHAILDIHACTGEMVLSDFFIPNEATENSIYASTNPFTGTFITNNFVYRGANRLARYIAKPIKFNKAVEWVDINNLISGTYFYTKVWIDKYTYTGSKRIYFDIESGYCEPFRIFNDSTGQVRFIFGSGCTIVANGTKLANTETYYEFGAHTFGSVSWDKDTKTAIIEKQSITSA